MKEMVKVIGVGGKKKFRCMSLKINGKLKLWHFTGNKNTQAQFIILFYFMKKAIEENKSFYVWTSSVQVKFRTIGYMKTSGIFLFNQRSTVCYNQLFGSE